MSEYGVATRSSERRVTSVKSAFQESVELTASHWKKEWVAKGPLRLLKWVKVDSGTKVVCIFFLPSDKRNR
jgi:hypothetical protein